MKEFEIPIKIKSGLRKDSSAQRNSEGLTELVNAKPDAEGIVPITALTYPVTDALGAVSWPFPQIHETS